MTAEALARLVTWNKEKFEHPCNGHDKPIGIPNCVVLQQWPWSGPTSRYRTPAWVEVGCCWVECQTCIVKVRKKRIWKGNDTIDMMDGGINKSIACAQMMFSLCNLPRLLSKQKIFPLSLTDTCISNKPLNDQYISSDDHIGVIFKCNTIMYPVYKMT